MIASCWSRNVLLVIVLTGTNVIRADEPLSAEKIRQSIDRGLMFLQADADKWRSEHNCSTCHQGTFTVFALAEAKQSGISVDAAKFADVVQWTKDRLAKIDEPRDSRPGWNMVNTAALYHALFTQFIPGQDVVSADELTRIRSHLLRHQDENGAWAWSSAPVKNRPPPFFESDEVATLSALITFPPDSELTSEELRTSRQKAIDWLAKADETDTTQAAVLRMLWRKRADPAGDLQPSIERFFNRQRSDGGFGQVADRSSDAYATGQSLYVLNLIGVPADRPEIQRAIKFLVDTQREDGSWMMTHRDHDGLATNTNTNASPITYFGSAWGTLGLIRTRQK